MVSPARWRVRFGYDGVGFRGWARQPGHRTIEGEMLRGLWAAGVVPRSTSHLEVASRTDRGVSARANALALTSRLEARALLRVLNGLTPEIYFTAAAPMAETARVRQALGRTYRYFEEPAHRDLEAYRAATSMFRGTIDVRSFGRALPSAVPIWRRVERMELRVTESGWEVEVEAPSFVWGMVRKMVGACRKVAEGRLTLPRLRRALEGRERLTLPIAEAEALVLWEVRFADPWTVEWAGPNRHQAAGLAAARGSARARAAVRASLTEEAARTPPVP